MFWSFKFFSTISIASPPVVEKKPCFLFNIMYDLLFTILFVSFGVLFIRFLVYNFYFITFSNEHNNYYLFLEVTNLFFFYWISHLQ